MYKKSLFEQNPYLKDSKNYTRDLKVNVLSSMAIEGVRKVAEKALTSAPKSIKA